MEGEGHARKGVTPRDERRGIVGRLLTSMHLLTCSNGLRYFYIKLTAEGQVSRGRSFRYDVSRKPKFPTGTFDIVATRPRISKYLNPFRNVFSRKYFRSRNRFFF